MAERQNFLLLIPPLVFAGLGTLFWLAFQRENPDELPSALIAKDAPALELEALGDFPAIDPAALRAPGVKLVNFWASWCGPCRLEHPYLEELAAEGVEIIGVNYKDRAANASAFLAELGNPYVAVGSDASGRTGIDWGIYGVPETFVINGEGKVLLRFPGPVTDTALERRIRPAMEAAKAQ